MLQNEHVNIRHLGFSKCSVVYCEVKCPFWLHKHLNSKLGKPFHLTLLDNAFFQLSFFLTAPNFLALASTLENLGARWLLAKRVNFVPRGGERKCLWARNDNTTVLKSAAMKICKMPQTYCPHWYLEHKSSPLYYKVMQMITKDCR